MPGAAFAATATFNVNDPGGVSELVLSEAVTPDGCPLTDNVIGAPSVPATVVFKVKPALAPCSADSDVAEPDNVKLEPTTFRATLALSVNEPLLPVRRMW